MRKHLDIISVFYLIFKENSFTMRTTLTIDDDLLAAAKSLARDTSETLGVAVSKLMRRGLNATPRVGKRKNSSGFPVFSVPKGAHPITLEDVGRAEDEE